MSELGSSRGANRAATPLLQRILHLDIPLLSSLLLLAGGGLLILYSATNESMAAVRSQGVRMGFAFAIMVFMAQIPPATLRRWTPLVYLAGLGMLVLVFAVGTTAQGAQRWLDLGIARFQPAELMKIAVPMAVAWCITRRPLPPSLLTVTLAAGLVAVPTALVAMQPDLGTALLLGAAGFFALFLAGMSWRLMLSAGAVVAACAPLYWIFLMPAYQKQRVLTLFNPQSDPLGTGYHIIQSTIAIGSGGVFGKGWLNGTQTHLDFLPEATTDFIFAVLAEEFGLVGVLHLLALYLFIVGRGLVIAVQAQDSYSRVVAGSLTLTFFIYVFVNVGMVTGLLPVVGLPLPLVSFGGSSMVTLMAAFGILMSIRTHRKLWAS
ncbi:MAG: rod shape-determining protein RodA [Ectothiorhodospiraceae bacterium]